MRELLAGAVVLVLYVALTLAFAAIGERFINDKGRRS